MILIKGLDNTAVSVLLFNKGMHLTQDITVFLVILGYQNRLEDIETYVSRVTFLHFCDTVYIFCDLFCIHIQYAVAYFLTLHCNLDFSEQAR